MLKVRLGLYLLVRISFLQNSIPIISVSSGPPRPSLLHHSVVPRGKRHEAASPAKQPGNDSVPGARLRKDVRQHLRSLLPRGRHPLQEDPPGDVRRGVQESQGQLYRLRKPAELKAVLLHPHGKQAQGHSTADGR